MINIYKQSGITSVRGDVRKVSTGEEVLFSLDADTLAGGDLHGVDLRCANLVGADLCAADLSGCQLSGADLSNADLTGTNLRNAKLIGCHLTDANLCGAFLDGSTLVFAQLEGADLTGSELEGATIRYCRYDSATKWPAGLDPVARGVGPSAARLRYEQRVRECGRVPPLAIRAKADSTNRTINIRMRAGVTTLSGGGQASGGEEVRFSVHADTLVCANLSGADLRWTNLAGADLRKADLSAARLHRADLNNADLAGANLRGAKLNVCNLGGADLRDACLADSTLPYARLYNADLTGSDLEGANLRHCWYNSRTIWPVGLDPVARGAVLWVPRYRYEKAEG